MAPSERSFLRSAESFAAKLNPPLAPSLCPICFFRFYREMDGSEGAAIYLQIRCHAFWAAVIGFISEPWTSAAEAATTSKLAQTYLECRMCPSIDTGAIEESMFDILYSAACCVLSCALENRFNVPTRGLPDRIGRWPTSVDQLFPHGADRTISSLVNHLAASKSAIMAIFNLVVVHRPLVFPLLLQEEHRTRLLTAIVTELEEYASSVLADLSRLPQPVIPAVRDAVTRLRIGPAYPMFVLYLLAFGPGAAMSDYRHIIHCWETKLFAAFDAVLTLLEGPVFVNKGIMIFVHFLWRGLSEAQRRELGHLDRPKYLGAHDLAIEKALDDPYVILQFFLKHNVDQNRLVCASPQCRMIVHDKVTPGGFSYCGKCRFVRYCSRACQKASWTNTERPHKGICDMLQELFTFATLDMDSGEFSRLCGEHSFPLERVDALTSWAGAEIMSHDPNYASTSTSWAGVGPNFSPITQAALKTLYRSQG